MSEKENKEVDTKKALKNVPSIETPPDMNTSDLHRFEDHARLCFPDDVDLSNVINMVEHSSVTHDSGKRRFQKDKKKMDPEIKFLIGMFVLGVVVIAGCLVILPNPLEIFLKVALPAAIGGSVVGFVISKMAAWSVK